MIDHLKTTYADRILPVDLEVAETFGSLTARRAFPEADALIAATALVHNLTVVTRNVRHFADTGARVLNPFTGRGS